MKELEEIKQLLKIVLVDNETLRSTNELLVARIAELESQLKTNSTNSHQPPSQDKFKPKPQVGIKNTTPKTQGGQKGHSGNTLKMVSDVDEIEEHFPQTCICGASLTEIEGVTVERRQVFDIPRTRDWQENISRPLCPF